MSVLLVAFKSVSLYILEEKQHKNEEYKSNS
jgi:hypothetical protein